MVTFLAVGSVHTAPFLAVRPVHTAPFLAVCPVCKQRPLVMLLRLPKPELLHVYRIVLMFIMS